MQLREEAQQRLLHEARSTFNGSLNEFIDTVRRVHEQIIDTINLDQVTKSEWADESADKATGLIGEFKAYLESHKDEIIALTIFYNQPFQRRTVTYRMIRELLDRLKADKPALAPMRLLLADLASPHGSAYSFLWVLFPSASHKAITRPGRCGGAN
jgi:type I restriction enzyme R subunit